MPFTPSERRLLVLTTGVVVAAAALIAVLLVVATGSDAKVGRVYLGPERELRDQIEDHESNPIYIPHPAASGFGLWLGLEDGDLVAYVSRRPGTDCAVKWRDTRDAYVDCEQRTIRPDQLDRYELFFPDRGERQGGVIVDFRRHIPAPNA